MLADTGIIAAVIGAAGLIITSGISAIAAVTAAHRSKRAVEEVQTGNGATLGRMVEELAVRQKDLQQGQEHIIGQLHEVNNKVEGQEEILLEHLNFSERAYQELQNVEQRVSELESPRQRRKR